MTPLNYTVDTNQMTLCVSHCFWTLVFGFVSASCPEAPSTLFNRKLVFSETQKLGTFESQAFMNLGNTWLLTEPKLKHTPSSVSSFLEGFFLVCSLIYRTPPSVQGFVRVLVVTLHLVWAWNVVFCSRNGCYHSGSSYQVGKMPWGQ